MNNQESAVNGERKGDDEGRGRAPAGGGDSGGLGARAESVGGSAQHAWSTTRDSITELRDRLDLAGRIDRHPYGMVAAAIGVGYVLGGGIFSPLTGRIAGLALKMALRAAAIPFIKDELVTLMEAAGGPGAPNEGGDEGAGARRRTRQSSRNTNQGR